MESETLLEQPAAPSVGDHLPLECPEPAESPEPVRAAAAGEWPDLKITARDLFHNKVFRMKKVC